MAGAQGLGTGEVALGGVEDRDPGACDLDHQLELGDPGGTGRQPLGLGRQVVTLHLGRR